MHYILNVLQCLHLKLFQTLFDNCVFMYACLLWPHVNREYFSFVNWPATFSSLPWGCWRSVRFTRFWVWTPCPRWTRASTYGITARGDVTTATGPMDLKLKGRKTRRTTRGSEVHYSTTSPALSAPVINPVHSRNTKCCFCWSLCMLITNEVLFLSSGKGLMMTTWWNARLHFLDT